MTTAWQIFSSFSKLETTNRRRRKLRAYEATRSCVQTKNAQWPGQRLCETAFDLVTDSSYILKYFSPIVLDKVALHIYKYLLLQSNKRVLSYASLLVSNLPADFNIYTNVSWVMEFLTRWVLKSKVVAQKSTVVKWNCCLL